MKLLLDTHAFLWLMEAPERLSDKALDACRSPQNSLWLSLVSLWEIQIKQQLGKLRLEVPLEDMSSRSTLLASSSYSNSRRNISMG